MSYERGRWRANSQSWYGNFLPKLLYDCLPPSISSARDQSYLCKSENALNSSFSTNVRPDSNKYKTYLCDYTYQGERWSVEIKALSPKEAETRMRAISKGEIVGELLLNVPVMPKKTWLKAVKSWLSFYN